MDIEKEYSCLEQNSRVYQKNIDVDEDYQESIPQYCDDIYRVVKCVSKSYVTSIDINYNEVKIFGKTEICLTYFNENSCLCYTDFEEEFTRLIDIENISENAFANATVNNKYINYRVINQRRIDFHNSLSINLSVYDKVKCPCISSCEKSKLKIDTIKSASIINTNICKVEFDEEFSATSDSVPIKRVVSSTSYVSLTDTKIIKDKALIKAVVNLSVFYTTDEDNEQLSKCDYSFNLSKIIDCSGVDENDYIIANLNIANIFLKAKSSSNDKLCVIEAYGEISINSIFIRENQQEIITDGYILNHNSQCSYSDYICNKNGRYINESKMQNVSFDLSAEITEIKELSISLSDTTARGNKLISKATANAMCLTAQGSLSSFSVNSDVEIDVGNCQNAIASLSIQSYDYTLQSNGRVEVRLSLSITAYVYENERIKVLSDIDADDEEKDSSVLTIYFAKENESVWKIAKELSSDVNLIIKENNLNSEIIDSDKILIIPAV